MRADVQEIMEMLRELQSLMSDEERVELWNQLQDGYCRHCGCDDPMCQCTNDE